MNSSEKQPSILETPLDLSVEKSYNYSDSSKDFAEKLILEKRRRYQAYSVLNYLLSVVSYFDFFSKDAFQISLKAKHFAQLFNKPNVLSEFLLLSFFTSETSVLKILKKAKLNKKNVGKLVAIMADLSSPPAFQKQIFKSKSFFNDLNDSYFAQEFSIKSKLKYSYETNKLFEKCAENALVRFKTPIISSEILFLTMMEEKNTRVGRIIKKLLKNDAEWFLLRYNLLKSLHSKELSLRNDVVKNQHYFGYLLTTHLSDKQIEKLINKKTLNDRVSIFRHKLISDSLQVNFFEFFEKDINKSIKLTNSRSYSS